MNRQFCSLLFCLFLINTCFGEGDIKVAHGRVESCPGCLLNRLPDVKKFIYDDVPKYENIEFKKIQGARPELVLLNESDEEVERIPLKGLSRDQCNELLVNKGFKLKSDAKEL